MFVFFIKKKKKASLDKCIKILNIDTFEFVD